MSIRAMNREFRRQKRLAKIVNEIEDIKIDRAFKHNVSMDLTEKEQKEGIEPCFINKVIDFLLGY